MDKKQKPTNKNSKEPHKNFSHKKSFTLGILGIIISLFSIQNRNLDFITYTLLALSFLVIILGFWQLYQSKI